MKLNVKMLLFVVALTVGAFQGYAKTKKVDPNVVGVEFRYWSADVSSSARVSRNAVGGELDLKKDAGLDEDGLREYIVSMRSGDKSELRLSYIAHDYRGRMPFARDIPFKGTNFTVGTNVTTRFEMDYTKLQWRWFFNEDPEPFRFGVLLDVKVVDFALTLDPGTGTAFRAEEEKVFFWMPGTGAVAEWQVLPNGLMYAEGSGMILDAFGYKPSGYMYDFEYGFRYLVCEGFDVSAGYRLLEFKASDSPDNFELGLDGFFIGTRIKF